MKWIDEEGNRWEWYPDEPEYLFCIPVKPVEYVLVNFTAISSNVAFKDVCD